MTKQLNQERVSKAEIFYHLIRVSHYRMTMYLYIHAHIIIHVITFTVTFHAMQFITRMRMWTSVVYIQLHIAVDACEWTSIKIQTPDYKTEYNFDIYY